MAIDVPTLSGGRCDTNYTVSEAPCTVAFWVKPRAYSVATQIYFTKGTGTALHFRAATTVTAGIMRITAGFGTTDGRWDPPAALTLGSWAHVAITYNKTGVSDNPLYYENGVNVALTEVNTPVGTVDSVSAEWKVGDTGTGNSADAIFDDFRIYSAILTADEILSLYNGDEIDRQLVVHHVWNENYSGQAASTGTFTEFTGGLAGDFLTGCVYAESAPIKFIRRI